MYLKLDIAGERYSIPGSPETAVLKPVLSSMRVKKGFYAVFSG